MSAPAVVERCHCGGELAPAHGLVPLLRCVDCDRELPAAAIAAPLTLFDAGGRSAVFSPCRTWRYELRRTWDADRPAAMFVGLNPSTADELADDPTVGRCITFARQWGYGGLIMTNLFGYRATDPRDMKAVPDPIGPGNDAALTRLSAEAGIVVAAWGIHGAYRRRAAQVLNQGLLGTSLHALGVTAGGEPKHPLYLRGDITPTPFTRGPRHVS